LHNIPETAVLYRFPETKQIFHILLKPLENLVVI